jgi:tetratricopeptide (TPR) repeat protein
MIEHTLYNYIQDPEDPEANFNLGLSYDKIGQTASALSFYLRSAERSQDKIFQYRSLIKCAMCFEQQGRRNFSVKGLLQKAIGLVPDRPEAYFLLCRLYERTQEWHECYLMASIGLGVCDFEVEWLPDVYEYPGKYGLLFEKGVACWWVGCCNEAREIMSDLKNNYIMDDSHAAAVNNNVLNIGAPA